MKPAKEKWILVALFVFLLALGAWFGKPPIENAPLAAVLIVFIFGWPFSLAAYLYEVSLSGGLPQYSPFGTMWVSDFIPFLLFGIILLFVYYYLLACLAVLAYCKLRVALKKQTAPQSRQ